MRTLWMAVLLSLVPVSAQAQMLADQGPPQHRIVHRNTVAFRYNPLGLLYDARFMYRYRLYESESVALRDNFVGVGLAPVASPAFLRIGPYVEVNPLTILNVWASLTFVQYFGILDFFQSFPSAQSNFSDTTLGARGDLPASDPLRNYAASGWELTVGASFQIKVKSIVLRSQARMVRPEMKLRSGDLIAYDPYYDVAAPNGGWFFTNDLDVVWQGLSNRLVAGGRYTATVPFYDTRHVLPGEAVPDGSMHRVGPFIGYTFKSVDGATFNTPTVFLLVQWWLRNQNRTGADSPQALPLLGIGFQTTGDFLSLK